MKKMLAVLACCLSLTACYKIETGQIGVETNRITGQILSEELGQGMHSAFTTSVKVFSAKQIPIVLKDLRPKASDNLRLQDFDVTVYYAVTPTAIADLYIKYSNSTAYDTNNGVYLPAYNYVESLAKSTANEAVSKIPSMQLNDKRAEIETHIKALLQEDLDRTDKGNFVVERVIVTNILTDSTVEESIQAVASSENKKLEAQNNLEVAKIQAEENRVRGQSLSESVLREKQLNVLSELAKSQNRIFVVPFDFKGIIQAN